MMALLGVYVLCLSGPVTFSSDKLLLQARVQMPGECGGRGGGVSSQPPEPTAHTWASATACVQLRVLHVLWW